MSEEIKRFNQLVKESSQIHEYTYCVRDQATIRTKDLKGEICCSCPFFVLNGGICDPL